jgi:hypothetical protein
VPAAVVEAVGKVAEPMDLLDDPTVRPLGSREYLHRTKLVYYANYYNNSD